MPLKHLILAVIVAIIWGTNFIFVKFGVQEMSPFLLCAIRFFLASVPAVFFVKWPQTSVKWVVLYGLVMFALQFSLIFSGLAVGMTAGMASLIAQTQIFFSVFFAILFMGEKPNKWQITGALVSFTGIGLVAMHLDSNMTLPGFLLVIGAAIAWGLGNLITKKIGQVNIVSLIVWGSLVSFPPLLLVSIWLQGIHSVIQTVQQLSWLGIVSILYIVYLSTWVGYGLWNLLLNRHPITTVAPFSLLVPVFAMLSSVLVFGETFESWKLIASAFVVLGLCINLFGPRLFARKKVDVMPAAELQRSN